MIFFEIVPTIITHVKIKDKVIKAMTQMTLTDECMSVYT